MMFKRPRGASHRRIVTVAVAAALAQWR